MLIGVTPMMMTAGAADADPYKIANMGDAIVEPDGTFNMITYFNGKFITANYAFNPNPADGLYLIRLGTLDDSTSPVYTSRYSTPSPETAAFLNDGSGLLRCYSGSYVFYTSDGETWAADASTPLSGGGSSYFTDENGTIYRNDRWIIYGLSNPFYSSNNYTTFTPTLAPNSDWGHSTANCLTKVGDYFYFILHSIDDDTQAVYKRRLADSEWVLTDLAPDSSLFMTSVNIGGSSFILCGKNVYLTEDGGATTSLVKSYDGSIGYSADGFASQAVTSDNKLIIIPSDGGQISILDKDLNLTRRSYGGVTSISSVAVSSETDIMMFPQEPNHVMISTR